MASIKIVKGFPISLLIRLSNDDVAVDVNDGTWTLAAKLCYQTKNGPSPFDVTLSPSGTASIFELTDVQTSQLSHLGTGYILFITAFKNDNSVFIENEIPVSVVNDL